MRDTAPFHIRREPERVVVAIPVRDEAERIGDCLRALAVQRGEAVHEVLLLLNNCTDTTEAVARDVATDVPIHVEIQTATFPPERAHAGNARRTAMARAAERAGPHGILMTTDADGRVGESWVAGNLAALRAGAEVVAGRALIDEDEAACIPAHLHEDDALETAYGDLLDEIDHLVDPDPADPWPRHTEGSGASIAVTAMAFRRAGGIPAVPVGEDRAFIDRLRRVDARIRHAPDVTVTVSGRIDGRARGGMAETIRRRIIRQDEWLDDRLEPARIRLCRAGLRARFRWAWLGIETGDEEVAPLARDLRVPTAAVCAALSLPFLGEGWARVEAASAPLRREEVRRADLARETAEAARILRGIRRSGAARLASSVAAPEKADCEHRRERGHRPSAGAARGDGGGGLDGALQPGGGVGEAGDRRRLDRRHETTSTCGSRHSVKDGGGARVAQPASRSAVDATLGAANEEVTA